MALFFFLLAKTASVYLSTTFVVTLKPLFSYLAGPLCSSLFARACAILQAHCCPRQHQQVYHFSSLLLSDPRSIHATLSYSTFFLLPQSPAYVFAPLAFWRLFLYDLWSRPWGVARLQGLHDLPPRPHPSEGVG